MLQNTREIMSELEHEKLCLQNKLKNIELEIQNLNKRFTPVYNKNENIKTQLEDLLRFYGLYNAIKVVSKRRNPTKTEYRFALRKSHKILKIFNKDLGNRKLFNQAKHYLKFMSHYDIMIIKRELDLIDFCIPEDTDIEYSVQYSGSEIHNITFSNITSNIYDMQYFDRTKQLVFSIDALPQIQCSIKVESRKDLFLKIKYCQQLARNL